MGHAITMMMILFCINFGLYLVGYQSSAQIMFNIGGCSASTGSITAAAGNIAATSCAGAGTNIIYILFLAIGAAIGIPIAISAVTSSSFSVLYTIPLAIGGVIAVLLLTPLGFIYSAGMPDIMKTLIVGVFAILDIGIIIEFIRGGSF